MCEEGSFMAMSQVPLGWLRINRNRQILSISTSYGFAQILSIF